MASRQGREVSASLTPDEDGNLPFSLELPTQQLTSTDPGARGWVLRAVTSEGTAADRLAGGRTRRLAGCGRHRRARLPPHRARQRLADGGARPGPGRGRIARRHDPDRSWLLAGRAARRLVPGAAGTAHPGARSPGRAGRPRPVHGGRAPGLGRVGPRIHLHPDRHLSGPADPGRSDGRGRGARAHGRDGAGEGPADRAGQRLLPAAVDEGCGRAAARGPAEAVRRGRAAGLLPAGAAHRLPEQLPAPGRERRLPPVLLREHRHGQPARAAPRAATYPPPPDALLGRRRPVHAPARGCRAGDDAHPRVVRRPRARQVPRHQRGLRAVVLPQAGAEGAADLPRIPGEVDGDPDVARQELHPAADRARAGPDLARLGPDPHPGTGDGRVLPHRVRLRRPDLQPRLPPRRHPAQRRGARDP